MNTLKIIVCLILACLIIAVVYDFVISRKRNRKKFGSDFFLDTIDKDSNASGNKHLYRQDVTKSFSKKSRVKKVNCFDETR